MPGGQITFDVDLRRPITDELEPAEQEQNLGVCRDREFTLPSAYEARYTNFPNVCLARYRSNVHCAHSIKSPASLSTLSLCLKPTCPVSRASMITTKAVCFLQAVCLPSVIPCNTTS